MRVKKETSMSNMMQGPSDGTGPGPPPNVVARRAPASSHEAYFSVPETLFRDPCWQLRSKDSKTTRFFRPLTLSARWKDRCGGSAQTSAKSAMGLPGCAGPPKAGKIQRAIQSAFDKRHPSFSEGVETFSRDSALFPGFRSIRYRPYSAVVVKR